MTGYLEENDFSVFILLLPCITVVLPVAVLFIVVFKFDHALGSLGGFVKTQISGSHLTIFDLVDV